MMGGFASQIRACKHDAPPTIPWVNAVALGGVLSAVAGSATAQALGPEDYDRLLETTVQRCLDPMQAGETADLSGMRPVTDVGNTVFTDDAGTLDDRIVLDVHAVRNLRTCEAASNEVVARFTDDDAGFDGATRALDRIAEELQGRGYTEQPPCAFGDFFLSGARMLEAGDYLRTFHGAQQTRPEVRLSIELSAARYSRDAGVRVEEHYGTPQERC